MGMFTTLFKKRDCNRCGEEFLADYQFHTGNDMLDKFKDGELVPDRYPSKMTYEASYTPLCLFCQTFIRGYIDQLKKDAETIILESGCELRKTNFKTFLWKGKEQVADYFSTGWFASAKPGKTFKEIEKKIVGRWLRQIKSAGIERWAHIRQEWMNNFTINGTGREYKLGLNDNLISLMARVHLGNRFRVEEIDLGGKDARIHLMDKALGIKRPEGK